MLGHIFVSNLMLSIIHIMIQGKSVYFSYRMRLGGRFVCRNNLVDEQNTCLGKMFIEALPIKKMLRFICCEAIFSCRKNVMVICIIGQVGNKCILINYKYFNY